MSWGLHVPHRPTSSEQPIEQQLVDLVRRHPPDRKSVRRQAQRVFVRCEPPSGVPTTLVWGWAKHHRSGSEQWSVAPEEVA